MINLGIIGGTEIIVVLLIILFPLIALISALSNKFEGNEKLIWVLLIIFLPLLGALLYFLIGFRKRIKK